MPKPETPQPNEKRELILHTLEGAALAGLIGMAAKRIVRDKRLHGGRIEPHDIVHSTTVKALERARQFRGEADIRTWLTQIVINHANDEGDKAYLRDAHPEDQEQTFGIDTRPDSDPERITIGKEEHEQMLKDMEQLSVTERTVLTLHYFYDFSFEEIAEHLDMKINTAKSHAKRARDKLREIIEARKAA